jgi:hypothetical protein
LNRVSVGVRKVELVLKGEGREREREREEGHASAIKQQI